jgi:hypothetical protein
MAMHRRQTADVYPHAGAASHDENILPSRFRKLYESACREALSGELAALSEPVGGEGVERALHKVSHAASDFDEELAWRLCS